MAATADGGSRESVRLPLHRLCELSQTPPSLGRSLAL